MAKYFCSACKKVILRNPKTSIVRKDGRIKSVCGNTGKTVHLKPIKETHGKA